MIATWLTFKRRNLKSYVLFFNKRDFFDKTFDLKVIKKFVKSYWDVKRGLLKVKRKKNISKNCTYRAATAGWNLNSLYIYDRRRGRAAKEIYLVYPRIKSIEALYLRRWTTAATSYRQRRSFKIWIHTKKFLTLTFQNNHLLLRIWFGFWLWSC